MRRETAARVRSFALGLFVVALALRLVAALAFSAEPVWDGHYYDFGARRIAEGFGYSDDRDVGGVRLWHPWCHYPVGYSAYLAAFYRILGESRVVAHVANSVAGAALAVAVYLLATETLSPKRARVAGVLAAVHPGLVLYGALSMSEPLAALGVIAAFWILVRATRRERVVLGLVLAAVTLGISALVRPQALLCAPFLGIAAAISGDAKGKLVRAAAFAALSCALVLVPVLPWTARNCRVMDGCALVSTNAGWNLAIGAFPRATGRFETLRASDGCRDVTGQVEQDRCWFRYGVAQIAAAPGRWLALVPAKLAYTFDHESFAVEYLHEARPEAWPEERRSAARDALTALHRVLVFASPLAFIAFFAPRRAREHGARVQGAVLLLWAVGGLFFLSAAPPLFWPFVVASSVLPLLPLPGRPPLGPGLLLVTSLIGTTVLAHAIFFGEDRYHVVVTPALCLLAAAALRPKPALASPRDGSVAA